MPEREALIIEWADDRVRFYYDRHEPKSLHIAVRHGTTVDDALWTLSNGETHWNETNRRFETFTITHGLYWTRHSYDGSVIVISCFPRQHSEE